MKIAHKSDKFKWNKSSLIETDLYIKTYIEALNKHLSIEDKQSLFLVSKFFTDAAAEVGRGNFSLAEYYYKRGEEYYHSTSDHYLLKNIITNVYDRSKSFYQYRLGNFQKAIDLINSTLENNRMLESNGFEFLIFDRVQQYHNLCRIYFTMGESKRAFNILSDITCFLISGKSNILIDLNDHKLLFSNDDLKKIRYLMLCQILFESTGHLQRHVSREEFLLESPKYFNSIIESGKEYLILLPDDKVIKKWILIIREFYKKRYAVFLNRANFFLKDEPRIYNGKPHQLLEVFITFVQ